MIKVYATSDTHNRKEWIDGIPADVDLILHAGDITDLGSEMEIERVVMDLAKLNIQTVICAGNHDMELEYNVDFIDYLSEKYPTVEIVNKAKHIIVNVNDKDYKIFVNPYVVKYGMWAFGVTEEKLFDYEPDSDTDIILCHCPPSHESLSQYDWHGHGVVDIGNKALTHFLENKDLYCLVFCGHNHLPYISGAPIGNSYVWNVATHHIVIGGIL